MDKLTFPKPLPTAISVGLALLIWFVIPVPEKVTPEAWHLLALFTGTIAAIIGKALPIGARFGDRDCARGHHRGHPPRQARRSHRRCAQRLCQPADLADRHCGHDRRRSDQDRAGHTDRLSLHRNVRQEVGGRGLWAGAVGAGDCAGHAQQHGARWRHHPPDHAIHRGRIRLQPGTGHPKEDRPLPGTRQLQHQSDHLGHVHHGHRAESADRGPDRQGHQFFHPDHVGPNGRWPPCCRGCACCC
jgi:hypothetical protein